MVATIDPIPRRHLTCRTSIPNRPRPARATTAEAASHARRTVGVVQGLGIGALCLVSAGAGAAAVSGGSVFAADTTPPRPLPAPTTPPATTQVIIDVVKAVSPAVVTINVTTNATTSQDPDGLGNGPQGFVQQGTGSGVIIDPAGLILTNHHVVQDADKVSVVLADGRTFDGTVAGIDTYTDLAFVKIDATGLPTAQLGDSSALQLGQLAIAMGDPLGQFPGSVTSGIVSGLDRTVVVSDQTGRQRQPPAPPHPDRRRHQPRQLRRPAPRRRRQGHRHRHRRGRLRDRASASPSPSTSPSPSSPRSWRARTSRAPGSASTTSRSTPRSPRTTT